MEGIYDDLDVHPDLDIEYNKLQDVNKQLTKQIATLETEIAKLMNELAGMRKMQATFEENISSLLKTARTELERKDQYIANLQKQVDVLLCRCKEMRAGDSRRSSNRSNPTRSPARKERCDFTKRRSPSAPSKRISPVRTKSKSPHRKQPGRARDRGRERSKSSKRQRSPERMSSFSKRTKYEHDRSPRRQVKEKYENFRRFDEKGRCKNEPKVDETVAYRKNLKKNEFQSTAAKETKAIINDVKNMLTVSKEVDGEVLLMKEKREETIESDEIIIHGRQHNNQDDFKVESKEKVLSNHLNSNSIIQRDTASPKNSLQEDTSRVFDKTTNSINNNIGSNRNENIKRTEHDLVKDTEIGSHFKVNTDADVQIIINDNPSFSSTHDDTTRRTEHDLVKDTEISSHFKVNSDADVQIIINDNLSFSSTHDQSVNVNNSISNSARDLKDDNNHSESSDSKRNENSVLNNNTENHDIVCKKTSPFVNTSYLPSASICNSPECDNLMELANNINDSLQSQSSSKGKPRPKRRYGAIKMVD